MRKIMVVCGVVAALIASSVSAAPAFAQGYLNDPVPPPIDHIVIDVATVNGSGCPAGTAAIAVSPDNTAFTVTYSQYIAQVGVGATALDFRKNCQLSLVVHVPQGFTYAIAKADYRGFASLARGATSMERANYYFQGDSQTTSLSHSFTGPFEDNWQATDETDTAQLVYAPCGALRNFNINTELRVNAGTSDTKKTTSFMTMDSTDGSLSTVYHFHWEYCH
jgi:hypothetical protein